MSTLEEVKEKVENLQSLQIKTKEELQEKTIEKVEYYYYHQVTFFFTDGTFALCKLGDDTIQDRISARELRWIRLLTVEEYRLIEEEQKQECKANQKQRRYTNYLELKKEFEGEEPAA